MTLLYYERTDIQQHQCFKVVTNQTEIGFFFGVCNKRQGFWPRTDTQT